MPLILMKVSNSAHEGHVVKENLHVMPVLRNYTHLHVSRFMQKVVTSALSVDRRSLIIWRCFSEAKAHQTVICLKV